MNAQAGIMIRSTFDPDSTNVFPHFYYNGSDGDVRFMDYRTIIGQGGGVAGEGGKREGIPEAAFVWVGGRGCSKGHSLATNLFGLGD